MNISTDANAQYTFENKNNYVMAQSTSLIGISKASAELHLFRWEAYANNTNMRLLRAVVEAHYAEQYSNSISKYIGYKAI